MRVLVRRGKPLYMAASSPRQFVRRAPSKTKPGRFVDIRITNMNAGDAFVVGSTYWTPSCEGPGAGGLPLEVVRALAHVSSCAIGKAAILPSARDLGPRGQSQLCPRRYGDSDRGLSSPRCERSKPEPFRLVHQRRRQRRSEKSVWRVESAETRPCVARQSDCPEPKRGLRAVGSACTPPFAEVSACSIFM